MIFLLKSWWIAIHILRLRVGTPRNALDLYLYCKICIGRIWFIFILVNMHVTHRVYSVKYDTHRTHSIYTCTLKYVTHMTHGIFTFSLKYVTHWTHRIYTCTLKYVTYWTHRIYIYTSKYGYISIGFILVL